MNKKSAQCNVSTTTKRRRRKAKNIDIQNGIRTGDVGVQIVLQSAKYEPLGQKDATIRGCIQKFPD
jgi:hypothetical protein